MVRRPSIRRALLTLMCLASAAQAAGQSLGETAQKTEEARKTSAGTAIVITKLPAPPPDNGPVRLSEQVLERYAEARIALAKLRQAERQMHYRLDGARRKARAYDELIPAFAREQPVVDLLGSFGLTPESYIQIEIALLRGRTYSQRITGLTLDRYQGRDRENVEFVAANIHLVNEMWQRCALHEGRLDLWIGLIPDFY